MLIINIVRYIIVHYGVDDMLSIPEFVGSIDIETKGTEPNAFILSIGAAMFRTSDLTLVDRMEYLIDPNDPAQTNRTEDAHTIRWWGEAGSSPRHPCLEAKRIVWSGKNTLPAVLVELNTFIEGFIHNGVKPIISMRGPDFDAVLLNNAMKEFGMRLAASPSTLDSARTHERYRQALQLPKLDFSQFDGKSPYGRIIAHTSVCDAIMEGYEAAYMFRLISRLRDFITPDILI